jgi:hypothetical protein
VGSIVVVGASLESSSGGSGASPPVSSRSFSSAARMRFSVQKLLVSLEDVDVT